ncbi:MAG: DUF4080 domain-containing protein [Bacteroidota bacterium]
MNILLKTFNARHYQSSLALPYLKALLDRERPHHRVLIQEGTIHDPDEDTIWGILDEAPDLLAFSCYLWNIEQTARIARAVKHLSPKTLIVAGGPEVGYTPVEALEQYPFDVVVKGEGEETFLALVDALEKNRKNVPLAEVRGIAYRADDRIVENPDRPPLEDLDWLPSPFLAGLIDPSKPFVYYETSRGCPFRCEFCASSLTEGVRTFSLERVKQDLDWLLSQRYQSVRVVDRTFNLPPERARTILRQLIEAKTETTFQLEIKADCLDEATVELLKTAPAGRLKFEIGLQSLHPSVLDGIRRGGDPEDVLRMTHRLSEETKIKLHIDLIAGLPGEDYARFLESIDAVLSSGAEMIQVGLLKLLPGTRIREKAAELGFVAMQEPPYAVLQTPEMPWSDFRRVHTLEALVGCFHNAGRFSRTLAFASKNLAKSPGCLYASLAEAWQNRNLPTAGFDPVKLYDWLYEILCEQGVEREALLDRLALDFFRREKAWDKLPSALEARVRPRVHRTASGLRMRRHSVLLRLSAPVEGETGWFCFLAPSPQGFPIPETVFRLLETGKGSPEDEAWLQERDAFAPAS